MPKLAAVDHDHDVATVMIDIHSQIGRFRLYAIAAFVAARVELSGNTRKTN